MNSEFTPRSILFFYLLIFISCGSDEEAVPENVSISDITATGFQVTWTSTGESVVLQVANDADFSQVVSEMTADAPPILVSGLLADTDYHMRLQFSSSGNSFTDSQQVTTNTLSTPSSIIANDILADGFELSWSDTGGTYQLDVALDENFSTFVDDYNNREVDNNSILVTTLSPSTTYYFRVRTSDGTSNSPYSIVGTAMTNTNRVLVFKSPAFDSGEKMSVDFACPTHASPPLYWRNLPDNTESVAIVMDDLDFAQGVLNHWIVFNIPTDVSALQEGDAGTNLPRGSKEGTNAIGTESYFGPCPPNGESHRYRFTFYALDRILQLDRGVLLGEFQTAIQGAVLSSKQITGLFE